MLTLIRIIIAIVLAVPLYFIVPFGWNWLYIIGLQILAGINIRY